MALSTILLHAGGNRSEASGRPLRDLGYGNRTPRCFVDSQSTGRDCGTLQLRVRYDPIWRDWATTCCSPRSNLSSTTTRWLGSYPPTWFTSSSEGNHLDERISRGGGSQVVRKRRMPCLSATTQVRPSPPLHATPYSIYQLRLEHAVNIPDIRDEVQHLLELYHIGQTGRAKAYRIWRPYWGHPRAAKSFLKAAMRGNRRAFYIL